MAWRLTLESQQPTWPQDRQRLRATQSSPVRAHSSHTASATGAQSCRTASTCSQDVAIGGAYARPSRVVELARELHARADAELGEHVAQVRVDRPPAEHELLGDLAVGAAGR